MIQCSSCGERQPRSEFNNRKDRPKGHASNCKTCDYWRKLPRKYGITKDEWLRVFDRQGGRCAICERTGSRDPRTWALDHCHSTGRVRGILCQTCNQGLGKLGDSIEGLQRAIDYLRGAQ